MSVRRVVVSRQGPLLVVGKRVDALVAAFQVEISAATVDELNERQAFADQGGWAVLRIGALLFALRRSRQRDLIYFENEDIRGAYFGRGSGGWNLELIARATHLATHELPDVLALLNGVAASLGRVVDSRLRRVDLAVDVAGFGLVSTDVDRIRTRSRVDSFVPDGKDIDAAGGEFCKPRLVEHRDRRLVITGITVAPGNPFVARIYNKRAEIELRGREEKKQIEESIWRGNGWDGQIDVARVEFQIRGVALDELNARSLVKLRANVDPLWQFSTRWVSLCEPGSASRATRWKLDPRWELLRDTLFYHSAAPAPRSRNHRRGARAVSVVGNALSYGAARRELKRIDGVVLPDTGEIVPLREFVATHDEVTVAHFVRSEIGQRVRDASNDASAEVVNGVLELLGPHKACLHLVEQVNARVARVGSIDDLSAGEREAVLRTLDAAREEGRK